MAISVLVLTLFPLMIYKKTKCKASEIALNFQYEHLPDQIFERYKALFQSLTSDNLEILLLYMSHFERVKGKYQPCKTLHFRKENPSGGLS